MSVELIGAFNAATTWQDALAAIKNSGYFSTLFENETIRAAYTKKLADLPDDQGREQAIGSGIVQFKALFGPFTSVEDVRKAVTGQIDTEHAKFEFITALDKAETAAEMAAAIESTAGLVNNQRHALIDDFLGSEDDDVVAIGHALNSTTFTKSLAEIVKHFGNDTYMTAVGARMLAARNALVPDGRFYGDGKATTALDAAMDAIDPIYAFNSASTWQDALAALKDPNHSALLFTGETREAYLQKLADLPDNQGREQAIGSGVNEFRNLFGTFDSVEKIQTVVKAQIDVEHAKHVLINTVNSARTSDELKAILKIQLKIVNDHRQALIENWSGVQNNPAVAARVAELKADTYTIWLEQLMARLNDDADGSFLAALSLKFSEARGAGNYSGVYSLLQNLDKAADEASPADSADDLVANGSQIYLAKAGEAGEITFTAASQSSWTDPDVIKAGTDLPSSIKIAFDGADFAGASFGRTTGAISEGGLVRLANPTGNTANFFKMATGDGTTPNADLEIGDQVSFVYVRNADSTYNIYVDANGNGNLDARDVGFKVDAAIIDNIGIQPNGSDYFIDKFMPAAGTLSIANLEDTGSSATDRLTNDNSFDLTLTGNEASSSVAYEFSKDGGAWTTTTRVQSDLADGSYTFRAVVTDQAGNKATTGQVSVTIDTTALAPDVALANDTGAVGDMITNYGGLEIEGDEEGATVEYSTDGGQTWISTFSATEGQNTVHVRQTDQAGNVSSSSTLTFTLDTMGPAAAGIVVAGAANGLNKAEATAAVAVAVTPDNGATVVSAEIGTVEMSKVDGVYTFDATKLAEGEHTVTVVTRDAAGNETATTQTVTIDTVVLAPGVALTNDTGADGDKITRIGTLTLTGVEADAVVEYSTDGGQTWVTTFTAVEGQNTVRVRQTDKAGNVSAATTFSFTLDTTAPEASSPLGLSENSDGTTTPVEVATLSADATETFTITGGADKDLFNIVGGKLVYVGGALNFESTTDQKSFVLMITGTDAAGNNVEREVRVNLTDVNEAPVAAATGNSASGNEDAVITGSVPSGSDVDLGDALKYELVAPVAGLTFKADGSFSYVPATDANGVVEFQYRVVDTAGAKSAPQTFTITVNAVNDAPRDITLSQNSVLENSAAGTEIGKLTASDPEGGAFTYTLLDTAGGRFIVDANGSLRVASAYALDYEQAKSHTIRVQVKDSAGATYEETMTINVTDDTSESVTGTGGSDVLVGGDGKDVFKGGSGNDKLSGGAGNDTLWGDKGKDVFVFDAKLGTSSTDRKVNFDSIKDFSVKDDSIYLDNAIFTKLGSGTPTSPKQLSKSFFTIGNKAKDKNDYVIYNDKTGVLSYDADGSGRGKAVEFAQLSKKLALTNKDFFVI